METQTYQKKEIAERKMAAITHSQEIAKKRAEENRSFTAEERETLDRYDREINECDAKLEAINVDLRLASYSKAGTDENAQRFKEDKSVSRCYTYEQAKEKAGKALLFSMFGSHPSYDKRAHSDHEKAAREMGFNGNYFDVTLKQSAWNKTPDLFTMRRNNLRTFGTNPQSTTSGAGLGGDFIQTEVMTYVIAALKAYGNLGQICRTIVTGNGEPKQFPVIDDTGNAATLVSQNTQVSNTEIDTANVTLNAYKFNTTVTSSFELLQDSVVNVPELIGETAGIRMARGEETYFATGTGSSQPQGVVGSNTPLVAGVTTAHEAQITYSELITAFESIDYAYQRDPSFQWNFHQTLRQQLLTLVDGQSRPIFQPFLNPLTSEVQYMLLNYPLSINNSLPTVALNSKSGVVGAFSYWGIRRVADIRFIRNDYIHGDYDQVSWFVWHRVDSNQLTKSGVHPLKYIQMGSSS